MPVPSQMSDLSTTAGSNSPAGSEAIGTNLDNYLRAAYSLIRQGDALASASIAAASTVDVSAADGQSVSITGAATINSLGTGFNGCLRELRFSGVCTLVHSASLALPDATNITTAAGDVLTFRCTGSGVWALTGRSRGVTSGEVTAAMGYTPVNKAGDTMTGPLGLHSFAGTNRFQIGTADGASYTNYNVGMMLWYGLGIVSFDNVTRGYIDSRTGVIDMLGGFKVNGQDVHYAGNQLALGTTAASGRTALGLGTWATKDQTVSTADPSGTPADGAVWLKYTP